MAAPSSTSSSDRIDECQGLRNEPPWAFVVAVVVLVLIEVGIRFAPTDALIPYSLGRTEYEAAALYIQDVGPADVSIVGSSRAREALVAPVVAAEWTALHHEDVTAANYACPGARAHDSLAIVRNLVRDGPPQVIIYGVSPRQLLGPVDRVRRKQVIFWDWDHWAQVARDDPSTARRAMHWMTGWSLSRYVHLLRYRGKVSSVVNDTMYAAFHREESGPSMVELLSGQAYARPSRGDVSHWHATRPELSLVTRPLTEARAAKYVANLLVDGIYVLDQEQVSNVEAIIQCAKDAGVAVVLVDVPVAPLLKRQFPPGVFEQYREHMRRVASTHGVPFIESARFESTLTEAEFIDFSHLNRLGAERFTRWIVSELNGIMTPQ